MFKKWNVAPDRFCWLWLYFENLPDFPPSSCLWLPVWHYLLHAAWSHCCQADKMHFLWELIVGCFWNVLRFSSVVQNGQDHYNPFIIIPAREARGPFWCCQLTRQSFSWDMTGPRSCVKPSPSRHSLMHKVEVTLVKLCHKRVVMSNTLNTFTKIRRLNSKKQR